MKLSTANGIRTFLINISKHCKNNECDKCPYELTVDSEGVGCYFDIMPKDWDIEHILECYKGVKK